MEIKVNKNGIHELNPSPDDLLILQWAADQYTKERTPGIVTTLGLLSLNELLQSIDKGDCPNPDCTDCVKIRELMNIVNEASKHAFKICSIEP